MEIYQALQKQIEPKVINDETTVFSQGDEIKHLYYANTGIFKEKRKSYQGIYNTFTSGEFLNIHDIFNQHKSHSSTVKRINKNHFSSVQAYDIIKVRNLASSNKNLTLQAQSIYISNLQNYNQRLQHILKNKDKVRNAFKFILARITEKHGISLANDEIKINVPLNQQEIAGLIHTSRETISVEMNKLIKKGLIKKRGRRELILGTQFIEELTSNFNLSLNERATSTLSLAI